MNIASYYYTNKGSQSDNEDVISIVEGHNRRIYMVCDGLGGHKNGKEAAELCASTLSRLLLECEGINPKTIDLAFQEANETILAEQQQSGCHGMKSTAVVLVLDGENVFYAHCGDSRLYAFHDAQLIRVTADHSVSYRKFRAGELGFDAIGTDEDRSSLLRAMGKVDLAKPDVSSKAERLQKGDAFLLCSDGFWEYLSALELTVDLAKSAGPQQWIELLMERHALRRHPNHDNYSAIAVMINERD